VTAAGPGGDEKKTGTRAAAPVVEALFFGAYERYLGLDTRDVEEHAGVGDILFELPAIIRHVECDAAT